MTKYAATNILGRYRLDLDEACKLLPSPAVLDESTAPCNVDAIVVVAGFERRSYSAITRLAKLGTRARSGLLIRYINPGMREFNDRHLASIRPLLSECCHNVEDDIFESDGDSADFGSVLLNALGKAGLDLTSGEPAVLLDISVGSSKLLLEGLHALFKSRIKLYLVYSESGDYYPTYEDYLADRERESSRLEIRDHLTQGVDSYNILGRMMGKIGDARPTLLCLQPAFAPIRVASLINEFSPNSVFWIFGVPHLTSNFWRYSAQKVLHRVLTDRYHRKYRSSTFDYTQTFRLLELIFRAKGGDYAIVVCSLGSKLQRVGQVLFHIMRPQTAALQCAPKEWRVDRFGGETTREVYVLDFGSCENLLGMLSETKALAW